MLKLKKGQFYKVLWDDDAPWRLCQFSRMDNNSDFVFTIIYDDGFVTAYAFNQKTVEEFKFAPLASFDRAVAARYLLKNQNEKNK